MCLFFPGSCKHKYVHARLPCMIRTTMISTSCRFAMATYDGGHCALFNVTLVFGALEHRLPKRLQKRSAMVCILSLSVHACRS